MSSQYPAPPRRINRHAPALIVAAIVAGASMLTIGAGSAAGSRLIPTAPSGSLQAETAPGEPIPLTPLSGLTSLDATVTITVDGTVNDKPTQGDLTARFSSNDQGMSQIDVTGSLVGDVVAQVGGKAISLFRPSKLSVYSVPDGTYVVVGGLFDVCVKLEDSTATEAFSQLSPQSLMDILTSSDVARGSFVGDETLNDMPVKHYAIVGDEFLAAAQGSTDPTVSTFAQSLRTATDADLYVAADGGYPVAYRGGFGGTFEPLKFEGDLAVQIDLTGINNNTPVALPGACDHPISQ